MLFASTVFSQNGSLSFEGEKHLKNIKQLTFGGENAEAYFSSDGKKLIFQSKRDGNGCDQIYTMNIDGSDVKMVSTGKGRTTCSFFYKSLKKIVYSSTHLGSEACPPNPDFSKGYVWPIYASFDVFRAKPDGSGVKRLTKTPGYDAEATVSPQGDKIVFTSTRSGDLELYTMNIDGSDVKQITYELGYDGGAFFSPDGTKLIFRSSRPKTKEEIKENMDYYTSFPDQMEDIYMQVVHRLSEMQTMIKGVEEE